MPVSYAKWFFWLFEGLHGNAFPPCTPPALPCKPTALKIFLFHVFHQKEWTLQVVAGLQWPLRIVAPVLILGWCLPSSIVVVLNAFPGGRAVLGLLLLLNAQGTTKVYSGNLIWPFLAQAAKSQTIENIFVNETRVLRNWCNFTFFRWDFFFPFSLWDTL